MVREYQGGGQWIKDWARSLRNTFSMSQYSAVTRDPGVWDQTQEKDDLLVGWQKQIMRKR